MHSKLSRGAIAAIAVCVAVAVIVVLILVGVFIHRRRSSTRRKQGFLQNPRLNRLRRFSWMSRSNRSHHADSEKEHHDFPREESRRDEAGVLDITSKSAEDMDEEDDVEDRDINARTVRRDGRVASQNSDGSFSIDLPKMPDRGYIRASTDSASPPPQRESTLSPIIFRTSRPRGPREMHTSSPSHGREGSRGILLSDVGRSDKDPSTLPKIETMSPLRVNFQDVPQEVSPIRPEERHVSTGATSIPHSLKIALFGHDSSPEPSTSAVPPTPTTPAGDPHVSFLDLESSAATSIKSSARSARQSVSGSTSSSSRPRDHGSTDFASLPPTTRKSFALSMNIGGGPTSSRPSLSPSISLQPIPLPPLPAGPAVAIPEDVASSSDKAEAQAGPSGQEHSPTESIPLTVSDIHFRHSSYSTFSQPSESRRASAVNRSSGSHKPPHPPLPIPPETKPFIVQKLLGMHGTPTSTPFASPTSPGFGVPGPSSWRAGGRRIVPLPRPPGQGPTSPTRDSPSRTK